MERTLGLLLALLLTLSGFLAEDVRARTWQSFIGYRTPYLTSLPAGEPGPTLSRRAILLIVRGLNAQEAETMPALHALRERGAMATLTLDTPTYATTAWMSLLTGATAEVHGRMSDNDAPRSPVDTLFDRISGAGGVGELMATEAIVRSFTPGPQLNDVFDEADRSEHDAGVVAALQQNMRMPNAPERLLVAEFAMLDAPRTPGDAAARAMAIAATDIRIEAVAGAIDLRQDTLIVVADRGRAANGLEGGDELEVAQVPLVLAGAGVTSGRQTLGRSTDVAPTVSMLLGIPIPAHAQGVPLWDLIESRSFMVSARQLTAFYEMWSEVVGHERFAAEMLNPFEDDLAAGARPRFEVWHATLMQAVNDARAGVLAREQTTRLIIVILAVIVLGAATYFLLDQNSQPPLIGALFFITALTLDAYFLRGLRPTLSQLNLSGDSETLKLLARDAALLFLATGLIAGVIAAFVCETLGEALLATVGAVFLVAVIAAGVGLWFYLRWGDVFGLFLPDRAPLIWMQFALRLLASMNVTLFDGWPPLPMPVLALAPAVFAWQLFGGRVTRA